MLNRWVDSALRVEMCWECGIYNDLGGSSQSDPSSGRSGETAWGLVAEILTVGTLGLTDLPRNNVVSSPSSEEEGLLMLRWL